MLQARRERSRLRPRGGRRPPSGGGGSQRGSKRLTRSFKPIPPARSSDTLLCSAPLHDGSRQASDQRGPGVSRAALSSGLAGGRIWSQTRSDRLGANGDLLRSALLATMVLSHFGVIALGMIRPHVAPAALPSLEGAAGDDLSRGGPCRRAPADRPSRSCSSRKRATRAFTRSRPRTSSSRRAASREALVSNQAHLLPHGLAGVGA